MKKKFFIKLNTLTTNAMTTNIVLLLTTIDRSRKSLKKNIKKPSFIKKIMINIVKNRNKNMLTNKPKSDNLQLFSTTLLLI
ncbi:MAG: hypothetical protein LBD05_02345 [Mycoplasmataceae bacterium]|nr:hypothetical protein [Mycoplasmataceae bacterium]